MPQDRFATKEYDFAQSYNNGKFFNELYLLKQLNMEQFILGFGKDQLKDIINKIEGSN